MIIVVFPTRAEHFLQVKIVTNPRKVIAVAAALCMLTLMIWRGFVIYRTPDQITLVPFDSANNPAYQVLAAQEKSYSDLSVLLLAGLWSLCIISKEERLRRGDWPEWLLFFAATVAFVLVFYSQLRYDKILELSSWRAASLKANIDFLRSPYLTVYRSSEVSFFFLALLLSALTVVSTIYLRPHDTKGATNAISNP